MLIRHLRAKVTALVTVVLRDGVTSSLGGVARV
jgi:hypothetical protein